MGRVRDGREGGMSDKTSCLSTGWYFKSALQIKIDSFFKEVEQCSALEDPNNR